MAGYGYKSRDHNSYTTAEPRADDWSKGPYAGSRYSDNRRKYGGSGYSDYGREHGESGYSDHGRQYAESGYSDHVCRPVIIDAEGRKKPIIVYTPITESYATTETIVEHVRTPLATEYKYNTPARVEMLKDHGTNNDGYWRPSSPVRDRPDKVEDFITKVQTEASRPTRAGLLSASQWRNIPNSDGQSGYGEYSNFSSSDWKKPPSGNAIRDEDYDNYYPRNDVMKEPTIIKKDGWERPTQKGWTTPPTQPLTKPTRDIGEAVELLKDAVKSSSITASETRPRFTVPVSTMSERDSTYAETNYGWEPTRRYGNFNLSSRPVKTGEETYSGTLDSRNATKKYNGSVVPR